jgi:hypothetical protein
MPCATQGRKRFQDGGGVAVSVGVSTGGSVGVPVTGSVGVAVNVPVGVTVNVSVPVGVGVSEPVGVGDKVGVTVAVSVGVAVDVAVGDGVARRVGVHVAVARGVLVGVKVGIVNWAAPGRDHETGPTAHSVPSASARQTVSANLESTLAVCDRVSRVCPSFIALSCVLVWSSCSHHRRVRNPDTLD